jgi:hypothetical protein
MMIRLLMVVVLCVAVPWVGLGAVYHVAQKAPGASDDNAGTEASPWLTIGHAAKVVKPGDAVYIHEGRYPEAIEAKQAGTAEAPIALTAFGDDQVLLDGADEMPAERWKAVAGFTHVFAVPLDRDPGQVFVDGKPVYMKVDKTGEYEWRLGTLTDADRNLYQFDEKNKRLLLNLGVGNPAAEHRTEVPVRGYAFVLSPWWRVSRLHAARFVYGFAWMSNDTTVEDCLVTDCGAGMCAGGWDARGAVIRRNTVLGCLRNGIFLQDRPTACRVEDNLVIRCTLNPWHEVGWLGSVKMNSASDSIFAHNVVLEAGNPDTINGWDGWALWGDINITRVMYVGNSCAHNKEAAIYVEYGMGDTRAYFNTSFRDGHGITCRASQRGEFMRNYVQSARSSGLAVWDAVEPYRTVDNVFAHNLVRDCAPSLRLQIEQPEFADYNTYWPREGTALADLEKGRVAKTLDDLRKATGHEMHGEVRDAKPEDVGLETVTFRVPDAKAPDEVLQMIGNAGCEYEDPVGTNLLPYFWHAATGDGVEHQFLYAAYTGLAGGIDTFAYPGAGGTVAQTGDPKVAHQGSRCLEVNGFVPAQMPADGLGFRSPWIPARPGDTIHVSYWVRGKDLQPAAGGAVASFAEFTSATGQKRQRASMVAADVPMKGSFDWRKAEADVIVPRDARRVSFFFGIRPATGTAWFDDLSIKVK